MASTPASHSSEESERSCARRFFEGEWGWSGGGRRRAPGDGRASGVEDEEFCERKKVVAAHERRRPFDPDAALVRDEARRRKGTGPRSPPPRPAPRGPRASAPPGRRGSWPSSLHLLRKSSLLFVLFVPLPTPIQFRRTAPCGHVGYSARHAGWEAGRTEGSGGVLHARGALRGDGRAARRLPRQLHRLVRGRPDRRTASVRAIPTRAWRPRASSSRSWRFGRGTASPRATATS